MLAVGFLLMAEPISVAQVIIRTYENLWPTPLLAGPLGSIQDQDGNGIRDIILGDREVRQIRIYSSATGTILRILTDGDPAFGQHVEVTDDVTGDGIEDLLLSGNQAQIRSGATLERVWVGQFFDAATTIGDIDGDGLTEFLLAGYGVNEHNGTARVLRGGTYSLVYGLPNPTLDSVRYGHAVASLGDVDGDGLGDYAISAPGASLDDTICVPGEVYVHSGVDGHVLYRLEGEGVGSFFGGTLASLRDVTGDGVRDLVVGEPACCQTQLCERLAGPGRVSFYDGKTGRLLGRVLPDSLGAIAIGGLGRHLLPIGDLDGNGWDDVITSVAARLPGSTSSGTLRRTGTLLALDGRTRTPIYRMWNPYWEVCPAFPTWLASAGDQNGDDFPDWFLSAGCGTLGQPDDRVHVISGAPLGVHSLGEPCSGSAGAPRLRIGATGVPEIGRDFPIHLTGAAHGVQAHLLLGDLKPGRLLSVSGRCAPSVQMIETRTVAAKDVRPGVAVATATISIPNDPVLIGTRFHAQWWVRDASGSSTTRVLAIEIQPQNPLRGW